MIMKKIIACILLMFLVGCSYDRNISVKSIDKAIELCKPHKGLKSIIVKRGRFDDCFCNDNSSFLRFNKELKYNSHGQLNK